MHFEYRGFKIECATNVGDAGFIGIATIWQALADDEDRKVFTSDSLRSFPTPLQAVDYWSRVASHHARGEFQKFGYFAERELSPQKPLLIMVAPALHVHPATDTLLRYVSPEIEWVLLGIDERWKKELKVVFRKRPERALLRTAV